MIKLTKAGKIFVGCFLGLFLVVSYMLLFSGSEAPKIAVDSDGVPLSTVFTTPVSPYKFPLSDEQSVEWHQKSQTLLQWMKENNMPLNYCNPQYPRGSLMDSYAQTYLRRRPIEFLAIVGDPASPYHVPNAGGSGKEIYPVYPIENNDGGEKAALQAMGSSSDSSGQDLLTSCGIKTKDAQGKDVAIPVLLEYPKGTIPIPHNQIVRVQGFIGGMYQPTGAPASAPLIMAGRAERAYGQEVFAPTLPHNGMPMEFDLNMDVRHAPSSRNGGVVLHLGKVQYAARQTRIWVQISNPTSSNYEISWSGIQSSKLQGPGDSGLGQDLCQQGFCPEDQAIQTGELQSQVDAGLLQDQPLAPRTSTQGWLVFPRMEYGPALTLRMPDLPPFDQAQSSNDQLPLIVKIRPPK